MGYSYTKTIGDTRMHVRSQPVHWPVSDDEETCGYGLTLDLTVRTINNPDDTILPECPTDETVASLRDELDELLARHTEWVGDAYVQVDRYMQCPFTEEEDHALHEWLAEEEKYAQEVFTEEELRTHHARRAAALRGG